MRWLIIYVLLLTTASAVSAEELSAQSEAPASGLNLDYSPKWPEPPDTGAMLLRLGFGTVVTLGLCVGTIVFGRRWMQRLPTMTAARKLQIEECLSLGHRASLYLVKIGESRLIAGTDASGLKSLLVLPTAFQDVFDQQVEAGLTTPASSSVGAATSVTWDDLTQKAA